MFLERSTEDASPTRRQPPLLDRLLFHDDIGRLPTYRRPPLLVRPLFDDDIGGRLPTYRRPPLLDRFFL